MRRLIRQLKRTIRPQYIIWRTPAPALVLALVLALIAWPSAGFTPGSTASAAQPASAVWTAQFYNNIYLTGTPALETQYETLELNWGTGSPAEEVDANNFSARFATDVYFEAGTYRFYLRADDAVQLRFDFPFDNQPDISTFENPRPGETVSIDLDVAEGMRHVQIDYRELSGAASVYVSWQQVDDGSVPTPPDFGAPPPQDETPWTAQYFANRDLVGTPVVTGAEARPFYNWGTGTPAAGVPADGFSARWSSTLSLAGGLYDVSANADDGIRVFVDGTLVINEFHTATPQTYTVTLELAPGDHTFVIEYYEDTGVAFIEFSLSRLSDDIPGDTPDSPGATLTVTAGTLNVRDVPDVTTGIVLTQVSNGETYPILAYNSAADWYQIRVDGITGWVSGAYVIIDDPPATDVPRLTGYTLTTTANLNIRRGPGVGFGRIGLIDASDTAQIIGRNIDNSWWNVRYNEIDGWVSAAYVTLDPQLDVDDVPITG